MILQDNSVNYLGAFLGGIAVSFSPCVYPLLPVTIGYIGIESGSSKLKGFILSLVYASGIAVTYCLLGIIASFTGTLFGIVSAHPVTNFVFGAIVIFFGISLLGVFNLSLPSLIKRPASQKQNLFTVFFLGLTSGLIIGPCLTPVLGAILAHLVVKRDIWYGATLLLSFSYGMGLILILAGTFSAVFLSLPKSGCWMSYVNKACAFILIATGAYFIFVGITRL
ncbi:MAG: hypothetical protein FJZ13_01465 [Candidatus Omnitrophica bacterium]|nr:hypothetical protein [Candidatus Omnitrophota bacterium]